MKDLLGILSPHKMQKISNLTTLRPWMNANFLIKRFSFYYVLNYKFYSNVILLLRKVFLKQKKSPRIVKYYEIKITLNPVMVMVSKFILAQLLYS